MCIPNIGYTIGRFIDEVNMVDASDVGQVDAQGKYIVVGKQTKKGEGVCSLLSEFDGKELRFDPQLKVTDSEYTMTQALESYIGINGDGESTLKKLVDFESGNYFVSPFKPGQSYNVKGGGKKIEIDNVQFKIIPDEDGTHKQVAIIGVKESVEINGEHRKKFYAKQFAEVFELCNSETKDTYNVIEMMDNGIIKPVVVQFQNLKFVVDNTYVYVVTPEGTIPIGQWSAYKMKRTEILDQLLANEAFKPLKSIIDTMSKMRKYIAPYWCMESRVVDLTSAR